MADDSKKSTLVTNADAIPVVLNNPVADGGVLKSKVATVEVVDNASIGSVYRMFRVKSSDRVDSLRVFCDTLTAAAADIGVYRVAAEGGAAVDVDLFASGMSLATASLVGLEARHEAGVSVTADIANPAMRVWELLGLTADPHLTYDLCFTLTAAATDPGTLTLKMNYVGGE